MPSRNCFELLSCYLFAIILLTGCASAPKPAQCSGSFQPINAGSAKVAQSRGHQLAQGQVRCITEQYHG